MTAFSCFALVPPLVSHLSCFPFQILHWKHLLSKGQCHHWAVFLKCQVLHLQGKDLELWVALGWAETPGSASPNPKFTLVTPGLQDTTSSSSHPPSLTPLSLATLAGFPVGERFWGKTPLEVTLVVGRKESAAAKMINWFVFRRKCLLLC